MSFTAQDVKALRESTGAGMMDCKKALEESSGDIEAAKQYLREKGLAASAKRDDRENNQGLVALGIEGSTAAMVQLKCETDFVAGSEHFLNEAAELLKSVLAGGADAVASRETQIEELRILLKEKIELGNVVHMVAADGNTIGHYEHIQGGRGVNGVLVEMAGRVTNLPMTSLSTLRSHARSTSTGKMFLPMWSRPSAQRSKQSHATRVSQSKRSKRSLKAALAVFQRCVPPRATICERRQAVDSAGDWVGRDRPVRSG